MFIKNRSNVIGWNFNIPNYNNRIFAFENQLTYDFGTVAFYGTGMGTYVISQYKLSRNWKFGLRAGSTKSLSPTENSITSKNSIFIQFIYEK